MKQENVKSPSKAPQRDEDRWIDVHDDELMIELGIRPPHAALRDKSVWTKTPYEKRILRSERCKHKERIHFHSVPRKSIPVKAKLIIYLKKNKKFPHTTYSTECMQHEIGDILFNYYSRNRKTGYNECLVTKYVYNGKTYAPNERPFWPGT